MDAAVTTRSGEHRDWMVCPEKKSDSWLDNQVDMFSISGERVVDRFLVRWKLRMCASNFLVTLLLGFETRSKCFAASMEALFESYGG